MKITIFVIPDGSNRESSVFRLTNEETSKDPGSSMKNVEDDRLEKGAIFISGGAGGKPA